MARKILVVDDDPDFVEGTVSVLQAEGFNAISASNGAEGFARARQEKPDLILLDVMMTHKT
ncbi:MAG TPA: response regulator, partial [bacterium]|nr:response regulator [bacterium]